MKKFLLLPVFILVLGFAFNYSEETQFIMPTSDFVSNFCNFPQAWTISTGKNVKVGVVYTPMDKGPKWVEKITKLAPGSEVKQIDPSEFLKPTPANSRFHILLILWPIAENQYNDALTAIGKWTEKGTTVILPAYFGPMVMTRRYTEWQKFVNDASKKGAIINGVFGRAYQIGNLSFWKLVPVDIYALHQGFDGDNSFNTPISLVNRNIEETAYITTAALALLKSKEPNLTPSDMKKRLRLKNRKVIWAVFSEIIKSDDGNQTNTKEGMPVHKIKPRMWVRGVLKKENAALLLKDYPEGKVEIKHYFEGGCLDAGLLLNLRPMLDGEWTRQVLRVKVAQKFATGKGVTVAILDHLFDPKAPSLKDRVVKPGSVLEGEPVFQEEAGHGTWMANELVKVAPDVKIMPIRICGKDKFGDADLYIKGIEYAVANGANIISLSHQPIPQERQKDFDAAIEKALQKGVTFVYIHYFGERNDVIIPEPIEFAEGDDRKDIIHVVGTNFINDSQFPYTWGFSGTAPIVSGVIALMLERNPRLSPVEIRDILLKSVNTTPDGYTILDAEKAINSSEIK